MHLTAQLALSLWSLCCPSRQHGHACNPEFLLFARPRLDKALLSTLYSHWCPIRPQLLDVGLLCLLLCPLIIILLISGFSAIPAPSQTCFWPLARQYHLSFFLSLFGYRVSFRSPLRSFLYGLRYLRSYGPLGAPQSVLELCRVSTRSSLPCVKPLSGTKTNQTRCA